MEGIKKSITDAFDWLKNDSADWFKGGGYNWLYAVPGAIVGFQFSKWIVQQWDNSFLGRIAAFAVGITGAAFGAIWATQFGNYAQEKIKNFLKDNDMEIASVDTPHQKIAQVENEGRVSARSVAEEIEETARMQVKDMPDTDMEALAAPQQMITQQRNTSQSLVG